MHLNPETTLDLIEERMDAQQRQFWTKHLESCKTCSNQLSEWKSLRSLLRRSHLENAPEAAINVACGLMPKSAKPASKIRTAIASLMFDSFAQPALAGARGAAQARQLVLRAEEFDIHIRISGDSGNRQLLGQLLPRGTSDFMQPAQLHLLKNGERFETTAADDMGEFHFTEVPEGSLSLQVDLPHLTVIGSLNISNQI